MYEISDRAKLKTKREVANQALREFFKKIKLNGLAEFLAKIK
jgi:hypothetical protein